LYRRPSFGWWGVGRNTYSQGNEAMTKIEKAKARAIAAYKRKNPQVVKGP
jgi:hypothetical protein